MICMYIIFIELEKRTELYQILEKNNKILQPAEYFFYIG
jgi:hypothetical protein